MQTATSKSRKTFLPSRNDVLASALVFTKTRMRGKSVQEKIDLRWKTAKEFSITYPFLPFDTILAHLIRHTNIR